MTASDTQPEKRIFVLVAKITKLNKTYGDFDRCKFIFYRNETLQGGI